MAFKMACPKCKGLDYSIERDNRTFGTMAQAFELVFHCRCGKQMFGQGLLQEMDRQKAEWEAAGGDTAPDLPVGGAAVDAAADLREPASGILPDAVNPARKKPSVASQPADSKPKATDPLDGKMCAWQGCENPARLKSKYCSRACSNKNARSRHKARGKSPTDNGAAAA